jgi:hypothetical protein
MLWVRRVTIVDADSRTSELGEIVRAIVVVMITVVAGDFQRRFPAISRGSRIGRRFWDIGRRQADEDL